MLSLCVLPIWVRRRRRRRRNRQRFVRFRRRKSCRRRPSPRCYLRKPKTIEQNNGRPNLVPFLSLFSNIFPTRRGHKLQKTTYEDVRASQLTNSSPSAPTADPENQLRRGLPRTQMRVQALAPRPGPPPAPSGTSRWLLFDHHHHQQQQQLIRSILLSLLKISLL